VYRKSTKMIVYQSGSTSVGFRQSGNYLNIDQTALNQDSYEIRC
jgi:hypothetical protein